MAQSRYVSDLFTVRTAYEFIINNCPASLDRAKLQSCDINDYLIENVTYVVAERVYCQWYGASRRAHCGSG